MPLVNSATKDLAPQKVMAQLGLALKRIIHNLAKHYNLDKTFVFSKVDLRDGFWRIMVHYWDAWYFCYVPPTTEKHQPTLNENRNCSPTCPPNGLG